MHAWRSSFFSSSRCHFILRSLSTHPSIPKDAFDTYKTAFLEHAAKVKPLILPNRASRGNPGPPSSSSPAAESPRSSKYAVLVPLCIVNDIPSILFTLRSTNLLKHKGEISFPGGKIDPSDKDVIDTALRETEEEIGLSRAKVDIWTAFPPLPTRDEKGLLTAVVGYVGTLDEKDVSPNPQEVEEIFVCSLESLCNPRNFGYTTFRTRGGLTMPVFRARNRDSQVQIWGMTAVILHNFLRCLLPEKYPNQLFSVKMVK